LTEKSENWRFLFLSTQTEKSLIADIGREALNRKFRRNLKMAKIDISMIEGYSEMTAEEKLAALEAMELPEPDFTGWVKKDALDKAASEAAAYKKQLREKMTAEEEKAEREAEERAALQARVEELERERTISNYVSSYLGMGYEESLAKSTAEALVTGDMETVFENQKTFAQSREKALRAEILKSTPRPAGGTEPKVDYSGKLAEAQASGDFAAVAYYTRLAQEAAKHD
jgi:hypothetical protein